MKTLTSNQEHTFLDMFGKDHLNFESKNLFELTIGQYPKFRESHPFNPDWNFVRVLEIFNIIAFFIPFIAVSALFFAACMLVPYRAYAIFRRPKIFNLAQIESAARQISNQMRLLKYYLSAGGFLLFLTIIYMSASREWPLAYYSPNEVIHLNFATDVIRSTILFQAGHFVLVLLAAFAPIAFRLRNAGVRLSQLATHNFQSSQQKSWMVEKGLSFTKGESLQQMIAIVAPLLVPAIDIFLNLGTSISPD